jgi:hypothetical protein
MNFLDTMPESCARQRELLRQLLATLSADPAWRWLELSCSLARHAGDELSDVDCGAGAADSAWPDVLSTVPDMVAGFGDVLDTLDQSFGTGGRHFFVQYEDGLQLSFVAMPATTRPGLPPQSVALLDKDGQLAKPWQPATYSASAADVREWAFLGWIALADLVKYLRRGSVWEAYARLDEARTQAFRVHAALNGAAYPGFGLTSILDSAELKVPARAGNTVAGLAPDALRAAARACAEMLRKYESPMPMADYVQSFL